jgi:hypothetical protein
MDTLMLVVSVVGGAFLDEVAHTKAAGGLHPKHCGFK